MAAANKKETPIFQGRNGMFVDFETLVRIEIDSVFFSWSLAWMKCAFVRRLQLNLMDLAYYKFSTPAQANQTTNINK